MCINCNLVAPVEHHICDLLGIQYNIYGVVSNTFDILNKLLIDMEIQKKNYNLKSCIDYKPNQEESKMIKIFYN